MAEKHEFPSGGPRSSRTPRPPRYQRDTIVALVKKARPIKLPRAIKGRTPTEAFSISMEKRSLIELDGKRKIEMFYHVYGAFYHRTSTTEYVYWDGERGKLYRTHIPVVGGTTKADLDTWEEEYQKWAK